MIKYSIFILIISLNFFANFLISHQEKEILDLEKTILELKKENNLMSVNISYIKRPDNLKLINSKNFNLLPIKTNHISNLEFYE